jgi:ATP-dependent HslUV protease ATP-binding subunit HslU
VECWNGKSWRYSWKIDGWQKGKKKKMSVKESHDILVAQESDKMIEEDKIITEAKKATEENGIVFLR